MAETNKFNTYEPEIDMYNRKINTVPRPDPKIGIDTNREFLHLIVGDSDEFGGSASTFNSSEIEAFTRISNDRNTTYDIIDTMCEDPTIAAALEIYAEDATETNSKGEIMWVQADDPQINQFVKYLLDTMNVDKNMYRWAVSLCKYGDLYLRLFRESEYKDALFDNTPSKKTPLKEDIIVKAHNIADKYAHYVEMVPNPADLYELTKLGKSYAYIEAPSQFNMSKQETAVGTIGINPYKYKFNKSDIHIYEPTEFVHASLSDNLSRYPEEVDIFTSVDDKESTVGTYTVKRGQSILYNTFKIWRQMTLLENAMLLNRISKSSSVKLVNVEVGDQPKEEVKKKMMAIKQLFEQKSTLDIGSNMGEYTNPGPVENTVYVPTHNGIGNVAIQESGGNPDVTGLSDVDFFKNKLYSSLKIPKQFLGDTDDAAGFSGGTSLSIISSRYAKTIKRIQNTLIQAITDCINLMLIDKGLDTYVNKFTLRMQEPTTQEEVDRRESMGRQINMIGDIMNLLDDVSEARKVKILNMLLTDTLADQEISDLLTEQSEELEFGESEKEDDLDTEPLFSSDDNFDSSLGGGDSVTLDSDSPDTEESSDELPSPEDLGAGDFTDNNMEI